MSVCENLNDRHATMYVLGCLLQDPSLVEDIDRPLSVEDFDFERAYQVIFSAIYNLRMDGREGSLDPAAIDAYLTGYPEQYNALKDINLVDFLRQMKEISQLDAYDYYYHIVRKFSLLRYYEEKGLDTRAIYDTTKLDEDERTKFLKYTEEDIIDLVESTLVISPSMKYCTNTLSTDIQASDGMEDLIQELMSTPDVGIPMNNDFLSSVARGARLGCLYMRSAPSGFGKSRLAAGDACKFAVPYVYDVKQNKYIYTGCCQPTVYISTEMTVDEIQSLFIAAVSKVDEAKILNGICNKEELKRIREAIQYIKESPLYIIHIPDFSITDITNEIKKYNREYGVQYFIFDYIHSSLRLMGEINNRSGGGLKEYQMLLVFATELKSLAQKLNIFILTASQLNAEAQTATYKDANLLQGSKALANKLDVGVISIAPNKTELKKIDNILAHRFDPVPNLVYWIYKLRRGKYTRIIIWSYVDLGTMSERPLFVTDYDMNLIDIDITKIEMVESKIKEHSIPLSKIPDDTEVEAEESDDETTFNFNW